ncbi:hypothetical protein HUJ04_009158 [Dendroctonus ponderosae]|nr:hypothetical protein HUJ04_009158 [Dendroctonus ponderosae]
MGIHSPHLVLVPFGYSLQHVFYMRAYGSHSGQFFLSSKPFFYFQHARVDHADIQSQDSSGPSNCDDPALGAYSEPLGDFHDLVRDDLFHFPFLITINVFYYFFCTPITVPDNTSRRMTPILNHPVLQAFAKFIMQGIVFLILFDWKEKCKQKAQIAASIVSIYKQNKPKQGIGSRKMPCSSLVAYKSLFSLSISEDSSLIIWALVTFSLIIGVFFTSRALLAYSRVFSVSSRDAYEGDTVATMQVLV